MGVQLPVPTDSTINPYVGHFVEALGATPSSQRLHYHGQKHLLTFGTPGANKSTGLVVPNLLLLRRSCIVIDPKGQLCAITKKTREKFGKVIVVNPFGELVDVRPDMKSDGWNPMMQLEPALPDFESRARSIAEAVGERSGDGKMDFFETSMENLWTAFTMYERRTGGADANLRNVRKLLADSQDRLIDTCDRMKDGGSYAEMIAATRLHSRLTDKSAQATSLQDVIETVMKNTAFLNDERIQKDMAQGGAIDFADLHRTITTVYVILPVGQLRKQAKWLRMFFKLALAELFESAPRTATLPPVMLFLDEFGNLGYLPEVLSALNIARDYRIQLWMLLQHLQQLDAVYPKDVASFFAGSGVITTFDCRDWHTAEHFSKLFGKRDVARSGTSASGGFNVKSMQFSTNTQSQVFPMIEPEDLWRLGRGRTISFIDPCPWPIAGVAEGYWDLVDKSRVDANPYFHA